MTSIGRSFAPRGRGVLSYPLSSTRGTDGPRETLQPLLKDTVGETVNDTVAETVANGKPSGQEGRDAVTVDVGALQQEIDDVGQPEDVEDTGDAEEDHGIALVRAGLCLASLPVLRAEAHAPLVDLLGVLLADAEDVEVGEADDEGGRGVEHHHNEQGEIGIGVPGVGAPLEHIPVISRLSPVKGGQEDQAGVEPNGQDADPQPPRGNQRVVGQGLGDGDVSVDADARQGGHGDALQH